MGALHEGHLSLIRRAREETDCVVVSIFVNPTQFGPAEDLARYPRPFEEDLRLCSREHVDLVFAPEVATMFPDGYATYIDVQGLGDRFEGQFRLGHFRGVATVVLKLFQIVAPDVAVFGQKDAQQAQVIRQMVRDLDSPIRLVVCPTIREPDGLALSSRNSYLKPEERQSALALWRCLQMARELARSGQRNADSVRHKMLQLLESAPGVVPDYAELVDPDTFVPVSQISTRTLAIVAARVGKTRLIDNLEISPGSSSTQPSAAAHHERTS
jgi:pantoate--beta-alanine ligase